MAEKIGLKIICVGLIVCIFGALMCGCGLFEPTVKPSAEPTAAPVTTPETTDPGDSGDPTAAPAPTENPGGESSGERGPVLDMGDDMYLVIEGNTSFKAGDEVEYTVKLQDVNREEGLLGLDLVIKYDDGVLEYESSELISAPSASWEFFDRDDKDGTRTVTAFDDDIATGAQSGEISFKMRLRALTDSESGKDIIYFTEVMGAAQKDGDIVMAYGKGQGLTADR